MSDQLIAFVATATAEVIAADPERVEVCVATHPGEPCPGWPHVSEEQ